MNTQSNFYHTTGGTLSSDTPSYVLRQADTDLYNALKQGEFCYVLNSSQMGKSSLMVRVADRLRKNGITVVVFELTSIGEHLTLEQWYVGLLVKIGNGFGLKRELLHSWQENKDLSPLQRWMQAIHSVVLDHYQQQAVVICIDEIGFVHSLPFSTDEFFVAIRECYNARTQNADLQRLTFCLIGVANPSDLIANPHITPFNIGKRIDLTDFTVEEATPLARGLPGNDKKTAALLKRILYWTNGHPYLTQKLCQFVANQSVTTIANVDKVCEEIFFSSRSRETDNNLQHVHTYLLGSKREQADLLDLYRQIRTRKKITDDETNPLINTLRLSGIVHVCKNHLKVRNNIYSRVFDKAWIETNMPDAEKRRQKAAFRRGRIQAGVVATGIIVLIGGGIYWYLDGYVWEHVAYYNTYAKRFGIMEGVGKLTSEQVRRRVVSYKFIRKGRYNPVYKVQAVTGTGKLFASEDKEKSTIGDEKVNHLNALNQSTEQPVLNHSPEQSDLEQSIGELTTRHDVGTYFKSVTRFETIFKTSSVQECQWEFIQDASGKIAYEKAYDKSGKLVWGLVYSPPIEGQSTRLAHYVGSNGLPSPQKNSSAEFVEFTYSPQGYESIVRYLDRHHQPQLGLDDVFGRQQKFNEQGLVTESTFLDSQGQPMNNYDQIVTTRYVYDKFGNPVEQMHFDVDGKPIDDNGFHKITMKYDERSNMIEMAFFDIVSKPIQQDDVHQVTFKYDERGNIIEMGLFDIVSKPIQEDGFHKATKKYDEHSNVIEKAYFDINGKPSINTLEKYHKVSKNYDERGNVIEEAYFNIDGKPSLYKWKDYHKVSKNYDERGNVIEEAYFNIDGKPTLSREDYHKVRKRYDEHGNLIKKAYFDIDGKPTLYKEGYHKLVQKYDERGNMIEEAYFDVEGRPILYKDGYHKLVQKYNERGNVIEEAYFDAEGKPTLYKDDYHKLVKKHNVRENLIGKAYFDIDGKPTLYKDGYHKFVQRYDERGNAIEKAYFDVEGKPTLYKDGYHKFVKKYNERGNVIEKAYFDVESKPTLYKEGYHKFVIKYDEHDNLIEEAFFDAMGKPSSLKSGYHKLTRKYDEPNNMIELAIFDVVGKAMPVSLRYLASLTPFYYYSNFFVFPNFLFQNYKGDIYKSTIQYDERSQTVEMAFFNTADKLSVKIKSKDDKFMEVMYFDAVGNLTKTQKYDKNGNLIEGMDFGVVDKSLSQQTNYKFILEHDKRGNLIENAYFDEAGNPIIHAQYNFHKFAQKFDEHDNFLEFVAFDVVGNPTTYKDGYHKFTKQYKEGGSQVEWAYFDIAGKPVHPKHDPYHKLLKKYDEHKRLLEESHFDVTGNLIKKYDERGNLIYEADKVAKPIPR